MSCWFDSCLCSGVPDIRQSDDQVSFSCQRSAAAFGPKTTLLCRNVLSLNADAVNIYLVFISFLNTSRKRAGTPHEPQH